MPDSYKKLVQVNGLGVVEFPGEMQDDKIAATIKKHKAQTHSSSPHFTGKTTEESKHARQLKPAQPLDSAIPTLPDWAKAPLVSGPDDPSVEAIAPDAKRSAAANERLLKATQPARTWLGEHPKTSTALDTGVSIGQGVADTAQGLTSPANMALMIASPESKIFSGLFAMQALHGSYKTAQEAKKAYMEGRNQDAIRLATQALLNAGIGTLAGTHALKGTPLGDKITADMKTLAKGGRESEHGFVENPLAPKQPQLKPTTAYKTVDDTKPFFLKSENLINEKMKGPMPAEDVHKMLLSNGVKPEEMKWTGLEEFLQGKGKQKITPQEI